MANIIRIDKKVSTHFLDIHNTFISNIPSYKSHGVVVVNLLKKEEPLRGIKNLYVSPDKNCNELHQTLLKHNNTEEILEIYTKVSGTKLSANKYLKSVITGKKKEYVGK